MGLLTRTPPSFAQVETAPEQPRLPAPDPAPEPLEVPVPPPAAAATARLDGLAGRLIEIVLPGGVSVRVDAQVDAQALRRGAWGAGEPMIAVPSGMRVHLACGVTDMRKGMAGLAMVVQ